MRIFSIIILTLFLVACNKPDPNPELKDPIYSDLQSRFAAKNQELEAEKKKLEGFEQELKDVIPQTGRIKYAQKRVYESQARVSRLKQEADYLELKIAARKKEAIKAYKQAFAKGEDWPNPIEFSSYEMAKKMRETRPDWDSRARIQDFKAKSGKKPPAGGHGEAPKAESGGH